MFQDTARTQPVTTPNQRIAAWVDKSPLGTVTSNTDFLRRPVYSSNTVVNNKTSVSFQGNQTLQFTPTSFPINNSETTFFFVINSPAQIAAIVFFSYGSDRSIGTPPTFGTLAQYGITSQNYLTADYYGPDTGTIDSVSVINTPTPTLMSAQYDGTAVSGWRNGTLFSGGAFPSPYTYRAAVGTIYGIIGASTVEGLLSEFYNGAIAEILGYSRALSTTERQQIEGYLAWKWGTNSTLPTDHPFYYNTMYALDPIPQGGPSNRGPYYQRPFSFINNWKPTNIPGCTLWFDANDLTTMILSGSNLTTWFSKGNQYASTVNVINNAYYSNYNGYNAIFFNSNAKLNVNRINYGSASGTTWITCATNLFPIFPLIPDASVVLATNSNDSGAERAVRFGAPTSATMYSINTGVLRQAQGCNANGTRGFVDTPSFLAGYQNGFLASCNTTPVTYQAGTNQGFTIGQWNIGYLYGYIYELIVYDSPLTLAQYRQVESYLGYKWGFSNYITPMPVPSTFGVYSYPPMPYYPKAIYPTSVTCVKWYPTKIPNLQLWLDAADGATMTPSNPRDGILVTGWSDKSGTNKSVTVSSSPTFSAAAVNKKSVLVFANGPQVSTTLPSAIGTGDVCLVAVWSVTVGGTNTVLGIGPASAPSMGIGFSATKYNFYDFGVTGGESVYNTTTTNVYLIEIGTRTSGVMQLFVNGTAYTPATNTTATNQTSTSIFIGNGSFAINGTIAEILVYNSTVNGQARQQIEGYLAWKWGLASQLPSDHPFKLFPPSP